MAQSNPSVVVGHLSDEEIKKSIESIVVAVDTGARQMAQTFDEQIVAMENSFKRLGNLKVDFGSANGGSSKRNATVIDQQTTAIKKQSQAVKDLTYDQQALVQQRAIGSNANIFSTIDTQIQLTKERLTEAKQQMEAFRQMAAHASTTGDKGLFTFATSNFHQYESQVASLSQQVHNLTQQRTALKEMLNPQGDGFKNYVDSLTKINPELAALNDQYKRGVSLLQQQTSEVKRRNQEEQNSGRTAKEIAQDQKRYIEQNRQSEQARKQATIETGIAAQQTARTIVASMQAQSQANVDNNIDKPITGYKELEKVIKDMRSAYAAMSDEQKKSQDGLNLQYSIDQAKKAKQAVEEYNREIAGMGINSRKNVGYQSDSYAALSKQLSNTVKGFQNLSGAKRDAEQGTAAINKIHQLRLALREIQNQMNRPVSLSKAMGLEENTLDRIAYKIQQLNAYRGGLNITDPKQVGEMRTVENQIDRLKKKQDELMGKNQQLLNSNNALTRSWNYMKNRLAFYFTVGASTAFVKNLIEVRSQYEMNERALGILIDSAERGTQIFNELSQMALVSPYTLIELSNAARQLSAYDVAAKDVVDTTRRMADIAAAVGIPMERLTYALGQIKAYGYLNSRDARMFLNAGIPLVKSLADHYTQLEGKMVSVGDVYDRIKKKAVDYTDVMQVINEMTDENGRFFDFQAKMADTLKVQLANLTLAWNNMLNDIGESEQGVLVDMIKGLKEFMLQWKNVKTAIVSVGLGALIAKIIQVTIAYRAAAAATGDFSKAQVLANLTSQKFVTTLQSMKSGLAALATSPYTWIAVAIAMFAELGLTMWKAREATVELNNSIINGANERVKSINDTVSELSKLYKFTRDANGDITGVTNINKEDAEKAWNTIREEIEMASSSSADFIYKLEAIEDVNSRIAIGFKYLQEIQKAQDALSNLDDDAIDVNYEYSGLWNFYRMSDGLVQNFKDMEKSSQGIEESWADIGKHALQGFGYGGVIGSLLSTSWNKTHDSAESDKERFMSDLQDTTNSIINAMKKAGVEGTIAQNEFYRASIDKILEKTDFTEKQKLKFRIAAEEQYYTTRLALMQQAVEREEGDYKAAAQRELNDFIAFHQKRNGYVQEFEHWVRRTQISELQKRFAQMSNEEMKHLDFSKGEWGAWVSDMAKKFAEQHNLSFDTVFSNLKSYLAQDWVLYIKTVVQKPDEKAIYDVLSEADKTIDEATQKIERLKRRQSELRNQGASGAGTTEKDSEYLKVVNEIKEAEEELAEARAKGGHGKKEEKNEAKERKQAESELMKALKEELSLIDNIRNNYKKLTKEGETHTEAIERAVSGYDKTVNGINKVLQKYGVNSFNPSDYAGVEDPNQLVALLEKQITALISSGLAKTSEIKDLEVKIQSLKVEARSYNLKKVTDGLNNELSKLKDEYELALELDADPILGEVFKEMFNIDPSGFPNSIDDYMDKVQGMFDSERVKNGYMQTLDVFKASEQDWKDWAESVGISEEALKSFSGKFIEAQGVVKKWAENTVKETENLQYKLADTDGKIAIENEKLQRLILQRETSTNEEERKLLDLKIKDQTETIARLGDEVLQMLPTYKSLFNSIADHSAYVTRKIAKQWKEALESAKKNADGTYTITDPKGGTATIGSKEYGKQVDKVNQELRKTASTMANIKEAFTKGKDGEVDFAKGLEYVAQEAQKAASGIKTIAEIVGFLGGEGAEESVEVLNDIATSMEGVGSAMQGYAKIQSGDVIGGAVDMIKGTWSAVSTWLDNSNKKINKQIKDSERQISALEVAAKRLQKALDDSYGFEEVAAKKATIANKELQLAELERQLVLEKSRKSKHQDKQRIIDLQGQIIDLRNEIHNSTKEIVTDLLGISSVGDAAETLVSSMIEAFKQGEDYMKVYEDTFTNMIDNIIAKALAGKIIGNRIEAMFKAVENASVKRADEEIVDVKKILEEAGKEDRKELRTATETNFKQLWKYRGYKDKSFAYVIEDLEKAIAEATANGSSYVANNLQEELDLVLKEYAKVATPSIEDIKSASEMWKNWRDEDEAAFNAYMDMLGIKFGQDSDKNLSALQQGIQGITEDTAGAIEAYMNGVSQQVYLHSDLLTQIRDAVVAIDSDAQLGVQAQMLLQLQQSYAIQVAIQGILNGWSTPSGLAVRVEMV